MWLSVLRRLVVQVATQALVQILQKFTFLSVRTEEMQAFGLASSKPTINIAEWVKVKSREARPTGSSAEEQRWQMYLAH